MTNKKLAEFICDALEKEPINVFDDSYVRSDDDFDNVVLDGHFNLVLLAEKIQKKLKAQ